MKYAAGTAVLFLALSASSVAAAQDGQAPNHNRGVITLPPKEITSPPMRPMASITISRVDAKMSLVTFGQALLDRIESSVFKGSGPF